MSFDLVLNVKLVAFRFRERIDPERKSLDCFAMFWLLLRHHKVDIAGSVVNVGQGDLTFLLIDRVKNHVLPVVNRHFSEAGSVNISWVHIRKHGNDVEL